MPKIIGIESTTLSNSSFSFPGKNHTADNPDSSNFVVTAIVLDELSVYLGLTNASFYIHNLIGTGTADFWAYPEWFSYTPRTGVSETPNEYLGSHGYKQWYFWSGDQYGEAGGPRAVTVDSSWFSLASSYSVGDDVSYDDLNNNGYYYICPLTDVGSSTSETQGEQYDGVLYVMGGSFQYGGLTDTLTIDATPVVISGFLRYLDYYPWATRDTSGTWQSCNRQGGWHKARETSGWADRKNRYSEKNADSTVFLRVDGGWQRCLNYMDEE